MVRFDLWGRLEVTMASEATNMVVRANMHMDFRVIKVSDYKSDIKFNIWGYWGCLEATKALDDIKMAVRGNNLSFWSLVRGQI